MKITVSKTAIEEIKKQMERNERQPRIYVAGMGCTRARYALNIDSPRDGDEEIEAEGTTFLIEKGLKDVLEELYIDYESEGVQMGFSVTEDLNKTC